MKNQLKRIAVFTSGGDAPGMNACLRAVVRAGVHFDLEIYGITGGYQGMIENNIHLLNAGSVGNIIQYGGTILKTAKSKEFMTPEGRKKAYNNLKEIGIDPEAKNFLVQQVFFIFFVAVPLCFSTLFSRMKFCTWLAKTPCNCALFSSVSVAQ